MRLLKSARADIALENLKKKVIEIGLKVDLETTKTGHQEGQRRKLPTKTYTDTNDEGR